MTGWRTIFGGVGLVAMALLPGLTLAQEDGLQVALQLVAEGFEAPVDLAETPDGRLLVVDQIGVIYVVEDGALLPEPFLDLRGQMVELNPAADERGLLGLALHPDYASNGRFFVYYTAPPRAGIAETWCCTNTLSEFQVSAENPAQADPASERQILAIDKPQLNHNAGDISFGPDGYLYLPLGDGGDHNDTSFGHTPTLGNGQDITNALGSILRIDVDGAAPYAIPLDNPLIEVRGVPAETWAWGFRNPWRATWDADTGEYFVADAGQNHWEEVNIVRRGGNYGWNLREGTHCFDPQNPPFNPQTCPRIGYLGEQLTPPVIEINNLVGPVIIGGYVYRGAALPDDFEGRYVFGFWTYETFTPAGLLFAAERPPEGSDAMWDVRPVSVVYTPDGRVPGYLLSFAQGLDNELYVLTEDNFGPSGETGKVWKVIPVPQPPEATPGAEVTPSIGAPAATPEVEPPQATPEVEATP